MPKLTYFILYTFCLLYGTCFRAIAQQTIADSDLKDKLVLSRKHVKILVDRTNKLSLSYVRKNPKKFLANQPIATNFNPAHTYWFKLKFRNNKTYPVKRYLSLGYVSLLDLYVVQGSKIIEHKKEGLSQPINKRHITSGSYVQASFRCAPHKHMTIYIKMRSVISSPLWLSPELWSDAYWNKHKQNTDMQQGIFQGLLWMMLLYNLFMYVSLKDRAYIYYVGYIFSMSVFFLYTYQYITYYVPFFGKIPERSAYFSLTFFLAFLFYYLLMRHFNHVEKQHPKLDKLLLIWIKISIASTILASVLISINMSWFYEFNSRYNAVVIPVFVAFLVAIFRTNNILGKYFAIGSLFMITGGGIVIGGIFMGIPPYKTVPYFQTGVLIEVFIFALGLSVRFRLNQEETRKSQLELIEQLSYNEELQENYSKELEATVEERTAELQHAYTNITDSVRYAQRIQQSILAHPDEIARNFQDFFIFFEPKDIVSGDFYWFVQHQNELIIAAVDCTGHGVPGAFMTIMGNDFLNEIVSSQQVTQPAKILAELDRKITLTLQKQTGATDVNDGMDMAILNINYEAKTLQYAGAKNPLWYVNNGEMNIIAASKFPVGSTQYKEAKVFDNHEIPLVKGNTFYIFSDGFQDQFGGKHDKKYMKRNFRELLLELSRLPLKKQHQQLRHTFEEWKQDTPQTDDVLVAGIKI